MRRKSIREQYFDFTEKATLKVVIEYREKYQALSEVLDENPDLLTLAHRDLLEPALEAHQKLFSHYPDVLAGDKGFYKNMGQIDSLQAKIQTVSIPKKGAPQSAGERAGNL